MHTTENDGRFPEDSLVEVRFPRSRKEEDGDREQWPWPSGQIVQQRGPNEWLIWVTAHEVARLRNGRRAPRGTSSLKLCCPSCYRDASEIRSGSAQ